MLTALIRILLLSYLGFGAYLYFFQRNFMYFPISEIQTDQYQFEHFQSDDALLKIWVVNQGRDKAVIYFGGNGENTLYNAEDLSQTLPEHTIYLVNYRGYGGSSGTPTESGLFQDAINIHEALSLRHQHISVIGRSLGSGIAVYLASKRPVEKMILVTPFDSITALANKQYPLYPVDLLLKDKYESSLYASQTTTPALLVVAENDRMIPAAHAHKLAEKFPAHQAQLITIPASNHNNISAKAAYWQAIADYLTTAATDKSAPL